MTPKTPSKTTQVTQQVLSEEEKALLGKAMTQIDAGLANNPKPPAVVGFDPAQTAAQEGTLAKAGAGGPLEALSSAATKGNTFLSSGDVMNLDSNPYLQGAVDAAVRPLTENFQSVVMPGVRGGAIQAGALGGSKSKQAGDYAASTYMRSVGDTTNQLLNTAYGQNLEAMLKGIALTPQTQSSALFPQVVQDSVGAQRRQLAQQQESAKFDESMFPFNLGLQLLGASAAAPGGGTSATVTGAQPQQNPLLAGLGTVASLLAFL